MEQNQSTTIRIFEKLDDIAQTISDIKERITRVETHQEDYAKENDTQHTQMISLVSDNKEDLDREITEVRDEIKKLREGYEKQKSILDERKGERKIFGIGWDLILALVGGGVLVTVGGLIAKAIGIF